MNSGEKAESPFEWGPYVQVACFCENVIQRRDGVLSLINIVDKIVATVTGVNPPLEMPAVHRELQMVLALKSGKARGRHEVKVIPVAPSGESGPAISMSVHLEGENKGYNLIGQIGMDFKMEGVYWFKVYFDDQLFTQMPMEVQYMRISQMPPLRPPSAQGNEGSS